MESTTTPVKWERELEALNNALNYYNLTGYKVVKDYSYKKDKYFLVDNKGTTITGSWEYNAINHFISGYGNANKKTKYMLEALIKINAMIADLSNYENAKLNTGAIAKISIDAINKATN